MKKVTVFSLVLSLCPILIVFFFTLTSFNSDKTTIKPRTFVEKPETTVSIPSVAINTLPLEVPQGSVSPLEDLRDQDLQNKLETILHSSNRWVELSKNKSLSIGIVDMQDPMHSHFASINGNNMMYAASLPKIAVLLASEDAIAKGTLIETPAVKQDMRLMIAKSNNEAASRMIQRVGIKHIGEVMQDPQYNLYDLQNGGGLWVGKAYGGGSTRIGDPLKNLSHAATVNQVCKYYYMLAFGQLRQ